MAKLAAEMGVPASDILQETKVLAPVKSLRAELREFGPPLQKILGTISVPLCLIHSGFVY